MTPTAAPAAPDISQIVGWRGLILPYDARSPVGDQRVVLRSTIDKPYRPLPLPLKYQEISAPGHDQARQGLAQITRVWSEPDGLYAAGTIDTDDPDGAALARKIALGFAGWVSADLETDGGENVRNRDGSMSPPYRPWRLTGATLVGDPAFEAARITAVTEPSEVSSDAAFVALPDYVGSRMFGTTITFASATFTVVGDVDLPWAPRDHAWDGPGAARRVQDWADGEGDRMARAFLWRVPGADPTTQAAYSLGYADVIDGELRAVYRGLAAAAGRLGQTNISPDDRARVQSRIDTLYERAAAAFDDPSISKREEMAMADAPADTAPVAQQVRLSDEDITRIVDAIMARMDAADEESQREYQAYCADQERAEKLAMLGGES